MLYKITETDSIMYVITNDKEFKELLEENIGDQAAQYYETRVRGLVEALNDVYKFLDTKRQSKIKEDTQKVLIDKIAELSWR